MAYQVNPSHDGRQTDPGFALRGLSVLWSKDLGGAVGYPLIVGNSVFVDVANSGADGTAARGTTVSAYDRRTGALQWGPVDLGGSYAFGAIAYDNGRIFGINSSGQLSALNAKTGHPVWFQQLAGQYSFSSPPTAVNGTVYVGGAGSGGTLYAVDEASGAVRWTGSVENGDNSSPAVDGSGVYVSYACEQAYSFTPTGELRWHHSTGCEGGGGRTPVLHNGKVYVRDDASMSPAALAESDGTSTGSFTSTPSPAFDGSTMLTLSAGTLRAVDTTSGGIRWSHTAINAAFVSAPLVVNGYVVEGDSKGTVHLLDVRSGRELWQASAGTEISEPDEHNAVGVTALAEAKGVLVVPAGTKLTVFGGAAPGV